jgi:hypothetical protein
LCYLNIQGNDRFRIKIRFQDSYRITKLTVFTLLGLREVAMDQEIELSLEQRFSLRHFTEQVQNMSCEQAQALLIEQYRLMVVRETIYRKLLKRKWKLDLDFASI